MTAQSCSSLVPSVDKLLHPSQSSARLYFPSYRPVQEEVFRGWLCPKICFLPSQGRCHSIAAWQKKKKSRFDKTWQNKRKRSNQWCVKRSRNRTAVFQVVHLKRPTSSEMPQTSTDIRPTSMIHDVPMTFLWRFEKLGTTCVPEQESHSTHDITRTKTPTGLRSCMWYPSCHRPSKLEFSAPTALQLSPHCLQFRQRRRIWGRWCTQHRIPQRTLRPHCHKHLVLCARWPKRTTSRHKRHRKCACKACKACKTKRKHKYEIDRNSTNAIRLLPVEARVVVSHASAARAGGCSPIVVSIGHVFLVVPNLKPQFCDEIFGSSSQRQELIEQLATGITGIKQKLTKWPRRCHRAGMSIRRN